MPIPRKKPSVVAKNIKGKDFEDRNSIDTAIDDFNLDDFDFMKTSIKDIDRDNEPPELSLDEALEYAKTDAENFGVFVNDNLDEENATEDEDELEDDKIEKILAEIDSSSKSSDMDTDDYQSEDEEGDLSEDEDEYETSEEDDEDDEDDEVTAPPYPNNRYNTVDPDIINHTQRTVYDYHIPRKGHPKKYFSDRAVEEGYRFDELSEREQQLSVFLYTSENSLSNYYLAAQKFSEILENPEVYFKPKISWCFPTTGTHYGFILDVMQSRKDPNTYYIKLLVSNSDAVFIRFTRGFSDMVYNKILNVFRAEDNMFHQLDFSFLMYQLVYISVDNVCVNNKTYSNIIRLEFINDEEEVTLNKMVNSMIRQSRRIR